MSWKGTWCSRNFYISSLLRNKIQVITTYIYINFINFIAYRYVTEWKLCYGLCRWEEVGGDKLMKFPRVEAPNGLRIRVSTH